MPNIWACILCYIMYFRLSMKSYVLLFTVILVFVVFIRTYSFNYVLSVTYVLHFNTETYDRATGYVPIIKDATFITQIRNIPYLRDRWQP